MLLTGVILFGSSAIKYITQVLNNHEVNNQYENLEKDDGVIGGYWKDKTGFWVAFDANSEFTVEEFNSPIEAAKYARGEEATTRGGNKI